MISRSHAALAYRGILSVAVVLVLHSPHASATAPTVPPGDPPVPPTTFRPGDVLYLGHDGSSVTAFTHARLTMPSSGRDVKSLLAGDDWNNSRVLDISPSGQVVLADIDGPAVFTTQLGGGPIRVLSGRSPGGWHGEVGDGPLIGYGYMDDLEFGPDGFVYLLTNNGRPLEPSLRYVMRIDPQNGDRSIAAAIEPPLGLASRFAFAPTGDLFVTLNFPADPNPLSSHNPMPPQPWSKILRVDVETGVVAQFPSDGYRYDFRIDDIAIGADGQALLLAEGYLQDLDLTTGATTPYQGFFQEGREVEIAPDGTAVVLSFNYGFEGNISVLAEIQNPDGSSYYTANPLITRRPFNTPFTMALVPIPEPSTGATFAVMLAIAIAWAARARLAPR
jgi:hypothetical protein